MGPRRPRAWIAAVALLLVWAPWASAQAEAPESPLAQQVLERLREHDPGVASRVDVTSRDGAVLLRGVVRLYEHLLQAERIAWTTDGVRDVENELRVIPALAVSDDAIEQGVRKILKGDPQFADAAVRVRVEAGFVVLKGLFQDPTGVLALKHRVAALDGVLHVEIEAMLVARRAPPLEAGA